MKIAINAVRVSAQGGSGFDTYIVNLINELGKLTDNFELYTIYPEQFPNVNKKNIKQINLPFFQPAVGNQGTAVNVPDNNKKSLKQKLVSKLRNIITPDLVRMLWTQFVFPVRLIVNKYDSVISMTQLDAIFLCPVNQTIFVYDLIPYLFPDDIHKHMFYLKTVFPGVLSRADRIISISENTKSDLIKMFNFPGTKIEVVYAADKYDNVRITETQKIEFKNKYQLTKYILFVGNSHPHKNLITLIKSLPGIFRKYPEIKLVVSGFMDPNNFSVIEQKIVELNLKDKIKFIGHLPDNEMPALYSCAELFVFPTSYEGFGIPPLESMKYGCPVVVSDNSSLPEVVGDAGVYIQATESRSIVIGIEKILTDPVFKQKLVDNGYKQKSKFSWINSAKKLQEILKLN